MDFSTPATYSGAGTPNFPGVQNGKGIPNFRAGATGAGFQPMTLPTWTKVLQNYQPPKVSLPLTGYGQAGLNSIEDSLAADLAGYGAQYSQIAPQYNLQNARLQTNESLDRQHLAEQLADRNIFNSGVTNTDLTNLAGDYNRQYQDLISQTQGQAANVTSGISGTVGDYYKSLADLYNQIASTEYDNPYSPVPTHDGSGNGGSGNGSGGNGGGGSGGGNGGGGGSSGGGGGAGGGGGRGGHGGGHGGRGHPGGGRSKGKTASGRRRRS
jgi:hypothetical protein